MDDLDIDGSLPGQDLEDEEPTEEIRRENDLESTKTSSSAETWNNDTGDEDSQRGMLYFIAGAGYGLLLVYLILVIHLEKTLPLLDNGQDPGKDALVTSIIVSVMFYVTIWFFMSGKKHSFFTDDPDKAKFYAGIIGLASFVIIALSWNDYSREMTIAAILTSISTWAYIRSSEMKS